MSQLAKRPADALRSIGAPHDLVEWVRKMPADEAVRKAWIDVTRVDWIPYIAVLRGLSHDAIIRAACTCALETAMPALKSTEGERVATVLRAAAESGRDAFATTEQDLEDLRLAMLAHGDRPDAPSWNFWCRLALELARAARRGNPMIGVALALKLMSGTSGRRATTDLIARFRDKLTVGA